MPRPPCLPRWPRTLPRPCLPCAVPRRPRRGHLPSWSPARLFRRPAPPDPPPLVPLPSLPCACVASAPRPPRTKCTPNGPVLIYEQPIRWTGVVKCVYVFCFVLECCSLRTCALLLDLLSLPADSPRLRALTEKDMFGWQSTDAAALAALELPSLHWLHLCLMVQSAPPVPSVP